MCLAGTCAKEASRQVDDDVYDLQKQLGTLPGHSEGNSSYDSCFTSGKKYLWWSALTKYTEKGILGNIVQPGLVDTLYS